MNTTRKSRYCFSTWNCGRVGRKTTILDRIRRARAIKRHENPDLFRVVGYCQPVYPGK